MIAIEEDQDLLKIHAYGEFTLADYKEFEEAVTGELKTAPKIKLLLDLTNMTSFTLDMAWEDIKFTRAHSHDFKRIAIVTSDEWISWLSWFNSAFTDAEIQMFPEVDDADTWVHEG